VVTVGEVSGLGSGSNCVFCFVGVQALVRRAGI